jgi:hypothetical protein
MICDYLLIIGVPLSGIFAAGQKNQIDKNLYADRPHNRRAQRAGTGNQSAESLGIRVNNLHGTRLCLRLID